MADGDEGEFECPYCSKSYMYEGTRDNHIEDKHPDEVEQAEQDGEAEDVEETNAEADDVDEGVEESEAVDGACDNHPDREAVWESDGVAANVVRYCEQCKERYT